MHMLEKVSLSKALTILLVTMYGIKRAEQTDFGSSQSLHNPDKIVSFVEHDCSLGKCVRNVSENCDIGNKNTNITCVLNCNMDMDTTLSRLIQNNYTNIENLTFILNNAWLGSFPLVVVDGLNITRLRYFQKLVEFKLLPAKHQYPIPISYKNDTFLFVKEIRCLQINIPLQDETLYNMIKPLHQLNILDLSRTRGISFKNISQTMSALPPSVTFLNLSHFQTLGSDGYLTYLNVSLMFPRVFSNLTTLDLSYNGLALIKGNLHIQLPFLVYIDLSHNLITNNMLIIYELALHPYIETAIVGHQGYKFDIQEESYPAFPNDFNVDFKPNPGTIPDIVHRYASLGICINKYIQNNIRNVFYNESTGDAMFCDIIQNCIRSSWADFPCEILPHPKDIVNASCILGIELPMGKSLKTFVANHIYRDPALSMGLKWVGRACFHHNKLEVFDISENAFWMEAWMGDSLSHITDYSGGDSVKEINLAKNNLNFELNSALADFKNLTNLNLSHNYVHISPEMRFCDYKNADKLKTIDLSYCAIEEKNISKTYRYCDHVKVDFTTSTRKWIHE